nr:hypothetical protein Iba_chr12bCG13760 [Ipomoea batatas]
MIVSAASLSSLLSIISFSTSALDSRTFSRTAPFSAAAAAAAGSGSSPASSADMLAGFMIERSETDLRANIRQLHQEIEPLRAQRLLRLQRLGSDPVMLHRLGFQQNVAGMILYHLAGVHRRLQLHGLPVDSHNLSRFLSP